MLWDKKLDVVVLLLSYLWVFSVGKEMQQMPIKGVSILLLLFMFLSRHKAHEAWLTYKQGKKYGNQLFNLCIIISPALAFALAYIMSL